MALTTIQRDVCGLLAETRRRRGESYVAGGVALNVALGTGRLSRDLDLFHDTTEAVARSWDSDRALLQRAGYHVTPLRERPGFVEADVSRDRQHLLVEWARDSAFRFFPLIDHDELGLTLHPFDLASNKVLAFVGRREIRDWIDVIRCDERVQPLGYLAWAASGKDPGFTPQGLLDHATRNGRYGAVEFAGLDFDGPRPDPAAVARQWHQMLDRARSLVARLPAAHVGEAVLDDGGRLYRGNTDELDRDLAAGHIVFHPGRIGGAWPTVTGPSATSDADDRGRR